MGSGLEPRSTGQSTSAVHPSPVAPVSRWRGQYTPGRVVVVRRRGEFWLVRCARSQAQSQNLERGAGARPLRRSFGAGLGQSSRMTLTMSRNDTDTCVLRSLKDTVNDHYVGVSAKGR